MPSFKLDAAFTRAQLKAIRATGSSMVVAKPTRGDKFNVAWQVFKPRLATTLGWEEQYGIYVSTTPIRNGSKLLQFSRSRIPSARSKLYTLRPSGAMSDPADGGTVNAYTLLNDYKLKPFLTVGLYQNAVINGSKISGNALSAAPVMYKSTAVMRPARLLYVWLQSHLATNTVLTTISTPMSKFRYRRGVFEISIKYDSDSGKFRLVGSGP